MHHVEPYLEGGGTAVLLTNVSQAEILCVESPGELPVCKEDYSKEDIGNYSKIIEGRGGMYSKEGIGISPRQHKILIELNPYTCRTQVRNTAVDITPGTNRMAGCIAPSLHTEYIACTHAHIA